MFHRSFRPSNDNYKASNDYREFQLRMMMQAELEEMYYDESGLEDYYEDDDFEEGPLSKVARTYRWVRPGYSESPNTPRACIQSRPVPPGENGRKKTPLEERTEEIERLKLEIAEKEKRLKLAKLQNEIKELTARVNEKEKLARKRQANAEQAEIDKRLTKKHERVRLKPLSLSSDRVLGTEDEDSVYFQTSSLHFVILYHLCEIGVQCHSRGEHLGC